MPSRKIVYPDADQAFADLLTGGRLNRLQALGAFDIHYGRPADDADYVGRIGDAGALMLGWDLPATVMAAAPNLEVIAFMGIGAGSFVDLGAARAHGITICNTPGYADDTVAEHALALMLAAARHVPRLDRALRAGQWDQSLVGVALKGKNLGIVGFGGIGRRLAELAHGIGMTVSAWTRTPETKPADGVRFMALAQVIAECDVLSVNVALTLETEGLIGAAEFAAMKPGVLLINTARGGVIDEALLIDNLATGKIAAAGLDVFQTEPVPPDHALLALDNVVLSPHVAYNTPEANQRICDISIENLTNYFAGRPSNVVT